MNYPFYHQQLPALSTDQMIEVDRLMIEKYGTTLMQMMENAGRNLAHLARRRFLYGIIYGSKIVVLAGTGGNGGGALVAARRLHNYGANVSIVISKSLDHFKEVPAHQLSICKNLQIPIWEDIHQVETQNPDLILDGILGYSLKGNPRGHAAEIIQWTNQNEAPVLSLDTPSGLDTTTGQIMNPCIQAMATLILALPKQGLMLDEVQSIVGELYLGDISVPPQLYAEPSLCLDVGYIFVESDIVRLR